MDIGYARVSTGEQTLDLQLDALTKAGCGKVYQETASGAKAEQPVLDEVLGYLRKGDTLPSGRMPDSRQRERGDDWGDARRSSQKRSSWS